MTILILHKNKGKRFFSLRVILSVLLFCGVNAFAGLEDDLFFNVNYSDANKVKTLLAKGIDVNARDKYGSTVLMHVAMDGLTEIAKLLIDRGADVNAKTGMMSTTALMYAKHHYHTKIVELLKAHGAKESKKIVYVRMPLSR